MPRDIDPASAVAQLRRMSRELERCLAGVEAFETEYRADDAAEARTPESASAA